MAREAGLAVDVLDEKRIAELKMGALLSRRARQRRAAAHDRASPTRRQNSMPGAPVLGLVGKAVTFDTGGISIKPANDMEKMKFDMAGGAAMLGAMRALAQLKPRDQSHRRHSVGRKYARRPRAKAGRRADRHVRQIHRSDQHRRRRPPDPGRRHRLRQAARRHAPGRRRDAHRRHRGRAGQREHRRVRHRRGVHRARAGQRASARAKKCGTCRSTTSTAT